MQLRRWSTYFTMACFFLAGGIEYSVIFPTMLDYVKSQGGEGWLYGLSLAAFSISNLVTAPLYGLIFDKTHQTKFIVLFANIFEIGACIVVIGTVIAGNFMYFAASSRYMILGSRFIVGVGAGAGATIIGELTRTTENKVRTAVFSVFMGLRQIGLVVGPAFNLFLSRCHFDIGPFPVNHLTAPGAFMAIVWFVVEVLFLFFFFALPVVPEILAKPEETTSLVAKETTPLFVNETGSVHHTINTNSLSHSQVQVGGQTYVLEKTVKPVSWLRRVWDLVREETVLLLAVLLVTMFNQTAVEAMCVPMAQNLLKWTEQKISLFYSGAGVVVILSFALVTVLSRCVEDRWQVMIGLIAELAGYVWLIGLVGGATSATPWVLWRFAVGAFFCIIGLPFVLVTGASLYSKLLPASIQGFGQGIRRSTFSLAAILGPLWAGGAGVQGAFFSNYYVLLGVPCGLLVLVLVLTTLSFSKLSEPKSR